MKEAFAETLHEQRDLLRSVILEVLEETAMAEAIREGLATKPASLAAISKILDRAS